MFDHIIFDVDGTLIDSADAVVGALQRVSQEFMPAAADAQRCRETLAMHTARALRHIGLPEQALPAAVARYDVLYATAFHTAVFPGITDTVAQISAQGIPMAVFSARQAYELENDAVFSPLRPYFHLLMSAEFAPPKPSPDGLVRYIQRFGIAPGRVLFIGDTRADSGSARAASVPFALAGWNPATDPDTITHQFLLRQPEDLLSLLGI